MRLPALAEIARVDVRRLQDQPGCPDGPPDARLVILVDASTGLEDRLLRSFAARCGADGVHSLAPSRIRRRGRRSDPEIAYRVAADEKAWIVPVRVVWMPAKRHGRRTVSWLDVLKLGDPRDPRWLRDYLILLRHPDRIRVVVGNGASGEELDRAHGEAEDGPDLTDFVTRRAWRALDRAEREARGNRYKIPRFVRDDLLNRPGFRQRAIELGRRRSLPDSMAVARARHYVSEIAATHSPFLIDLIANLIHWVIRQGYGAIHYQRADIERIARLGRDSPLVFLPSHKSNLDRLSLQFMLWENDLPPNHTAGGINMNFFPVGALVRRTGVFFIRRSFKGNELYKYVLRTYLDYLVEKRFPLEWYMEGGRSRSGRLRPPRYGMLSWVVDSFRRGKAGDLYLLPISITYDQIQEVGAYVTEATGGAKEKETLSWAFKFARSLRRRYGDIHIRFAEPVSVAAELAGADLDDDDPVEVQKLALEVMYRMSQVTPVTPTALVSTVLLAAKGTARDLDTVTEDCGVLTDYIRRRQIPTTVDPMPETPDSVLTTLSLMTEHGLVSSHHSGGRTVYWMEGGQNLRSAYYANAVLHHFVPRGLAEIAMASSHDLDSFWTEVLDLRDLLKFEFFFADKSEFRDSVTAELDTEHPDWEAVVAEGRGASIEMSPSTSPWAVLPLLESYLIVADELAATSGLVVEDEFLTECLERGRLYRLEGRVASDESVSQVTFRSALALAENRGLTGDDDPADRVAFAATLSGYVGAAKGGQQQALTILGSARMTNPDQ